MTRIIKCIVGTVAISVVLILAIVNLVIFTIIVLLVCAPLKLCTSEQYLSYANGVIQIADKACDAIINWVY